MIIKSGTGGSAMSQEHLICEKRTYTHVSHTHHHNYGQLILPLQGHLSIQTDEHDLVLDEKHLFYLPSQSRHSFYANQSNSFIVLDIPEIQQLVFSSGGLRNETYQEIDERWAAIRVLLKEESNRSSNQQTLTHLFGYASQFLAQEIQPKSITYIHAHYQEPITLKALASIEGFNETYYVEWFQKATGITPIKYIQKLRLEKAKELLINSDYSLALIAQLVGYEHQSSFTRLFKKHENTAPSVFRQMNQISDKNA